LEDLIYVIFVTVNFMNPDVVEHPRALQDVTVKLSVIVNEEVELSHGVAVTLKLQVTPDWLQLVCCWVEAVLRASTRLCANWLMSPLFCVVKD